MVVPKKNGTLRICLDPQNLNKAFLREHYALPTIEDIATRLHGAKLFTILDVRCGFWHVELDESSSYLTTFRPALQLTHASYDGRLRGMSRFRKESVAIDIAPKGSECRERMRKMHRAQHARTHTGRLR